MLINWFFPDMVKREREEHKQLLHDLTEFYKLCKVKEVKKRMSKEKPFVLTGKIQDLKSKTGSISLLKVESSNIKGIGFRNNLLYVAFNTDLVYSYEKVPQQIIVDFFKADSKGKYFNIFIRKPGYSYKKAGKL
jgi:hypothetical protein